MLIKLLVGILQILSTQVYCVATCEDVGGSGAFGAAAVVAEESTE